MSASEPTACTPVLVRSIDVGWASRPDLGLRVGHIAMSSDGSANVAETRLRWDVEAVQAVLPGTDFYAVERIINYVTSRIMSIENAEDMSRIVSDTGAPYRFSPTSESTLAEFRKLLIPGTIRTFGFCEAISCIGRGYRVRRASWPRGLCIFNGKPIFFDDGGLSFGGHSLLLQLDENLSVTSHTLDYEDVRAIDWCKTFVWDLAGLIVGPWEPS